MNIRNSLIVFLLTGAFELSYSGHVSPRTAEQIVMPAGESIVFDPSYDHGSVTTTLTVWPSSPASTIDDVTDTVTFNTAGQVYVVNYEVIHTGSASEACSTTTFTYSVLVPSVSVTPELSPESFVLWYFEGLSPANYPNTAKFTAQVWPEGFASEFEWEPIDSSGRFEVAFGFLGFNTYKSTVTSLAKSGEVGDCTVRARLKDYPDVFDDWSFTVDYLDECAHTGTDTYGYSPFDVWMTTLPYQCFSKFGAAMTGSIEFNEEFTGYSQFYPSCDWSRPSGGSHPVNPNNIVDIITPSSPVYHPVPVRPFLGGASISTVQVDSYPGEWKFGSNTTGSGTTGMTATWVRFVDHGEHQ